MPAAIRPVRPDGIPTDARVYHYDELDDRTKERFPQLLEDAGTRGALDDEVAADLRGYDLVKFTEYYRIVRT